MSGLLWVLIVTTATLISASVQALPPDNTHGHLPLTRHKKPALQFLPMKLNTALNAETPVHDPVVARLILPVDYESRLLPLDSLLKGEVTQHKPGQRFGKRTRLGIQWTHWCPSGLACQPIPANQAQSFLPSVDTGTTTRAFKRYLPLQLLSYGISIPLGFTGMPFWSTMFIEQGVGAAMGAGYETLRPEDETETRTRRLVKGALNSTSLPTLTRFVKKAPPIDIPADTALWIPVDQAMLDWLSEATPTAK